MKKIYVLSGLGADKRVFKYLDFSDYEVTFIDWIIPIYSEKIEDYAKRLSNVITCQKPIIVGLSFGGMMAVEVGRLLETEKIIVIASAKTKNEIPFYYKLAGTLKLHKLLPTKLMKQANFFSYWLFGVSSKEDKKLLTEILHDTDEVFLKWAINTIVTWKNNFVPINTKHIHGTLDRILPIEFVKCDIRIKSGGHFMTINKFDELNIEINKLIKE